jgi:hypothetical protein
MLDLQERILEAQSATAQVRHELAKRATEEYFKALNVVGYPTARDFEAGTQRAAAVLREISVGSSDGPAVEPSTDAALRLAFDTIAPPLQIAQPAIPSQVKALPLAVAALAGAFAGMLLLSPLLRLAFDMRDLGLLLGGPSGAFLAVLAVYRLSRVPVLAKVLPWAFSRKSFRGTVRSEHEKLVRLCAEQWLSWAVSMLAALRFYESQPAPAQTDKDKTLRHLADRIYALHEASAKSLPVVANELIQEARNRGFQGLEGPAGFESGRNEEPLVPTLIWNKTLQSQYETFGQIAEGDRVTVERLAVILGGEVLHRGLVRKVRNGT